jgi:peptidoglycan DL-endopeptidase CwlO
MRFGCPLLLALVLLIFPAVGAAEPGVSSTETEDQITAQIEHTLMARGAAEDVRLPEAGGRPRVVAVALRYLGVPYRWAGASPQGFDCSGFVMFVFGKVGIHLPHNAAMQYGRGHFVARSDLQPGDVVFFNGLSHSGIYIGRGRFVHSPHSGDVVKVSSLRESWYGRTYVGARRY